MKLSRLIIEHDKFKDGLSGNFGDGYLLSKNSVYRNIREASLKRGYQPSDKRDEAYETFPLLQLDRILSEKRLPYFNNMAAFRLMTPSQLETLEYEDIVGNLKKNTLFHEAAHAVARELLPKALDKVGDLESERQDLLRLFLEESAANLTELWGLREAHDNIHRIFYELNSFNTMFESRSALLKAEQELGAEAILKFLFLSYVLSNSLRPGIEDKDFRVMLDFAGLSHTNAQAQKSLRALGKLSFKLSERFRHQTTDFHLRMKGVRTPLAKLIDYDILQKLRTDQNLKDAISAFTIVLVSS